MAKPGFGKIGTGAGVTAGAKHTAYAQLRTAAHQMKVLGMSGGYYPSIGKQVHHSNRFYQRAGGGSVGRFLDVEGINYRRGSKYGAVIGKQARYPIAPHGMARAGMGRDVGGNEAAWYKRVPQGEYQSAFNDILMDIYAHAAQPPVDFYGTRAAQNFDNPSRGMIGGKDDPRGGPIRSGPREYDLNDQTMMWGDTEDTGMPFGDVGLMKTLVEDAGSQVEPDGGAPGKAVQKILNQYRQMSSKYTHDYLSTLDSAARYLVRTKAKSPTKESGREIPLTKGAITVEEQTKAGAIHFKGGEAIAAGEMGKTYGRTGQIDTFIKIMGNIMPADVTEMLISTGGHHGIGPRIMKKVDIDKALTQGAEGEERIRKNVYEYFQDQIPAYNAAIKGIKKQAEVTYKIQETEGRTNVTPAEMRAAFGPAQYWIDNAGKKIHALQSTNMDKRSFNVETEFLRQKLKTSGAKALSSSSKAVMEKLFKKGTKGETQVKGIRRKSISVTKTSVAFALHALGTWEQHNGRYMNYLTVSHDPHVVAGVLMRMHGQYADKAYEYKRLRDKDVVIRYGYAILDAAYKMGVLSQQDYDKAVYDMKAANIFSLYARGASHGAVNRLVYTTLRLGKYLKPQYGVIIPDLAGDWQKGITGRGGTGIMARIHKALNKDFSNMSGLLSRALGSGGSAVRDDSTSAFNTRLAEFQDTLISQNAPVVQWPENAWVTPLPFIGLIEQK